MSVIKNTPHILKHSGVSFTTVLNKTLDAIKNNATLGVYVYLASKPSDWDISEKNLQNRFGKGRDHIRACLAELKLLGLLKSVAIKGKDGRIIRWESVLYSEVQITENPHSGFSSHLENPPTTNKRYKQIKDINKPPISPTGGSVRFDEFWDMYPVKAGKKTCLDKWKKRNLDSIADIIIDSLYKQIHEDDVWKRGYIPNPLTYINQDRWEDVVRKPNIAAIAAKKDFYDDEDTSWADGII